MNYFQRLDEIFLLEAIPMSLARPYIKKGKELNFKNLYPELFTTGKDRVYFDFQPSDESTGEVFPKIQSYLSKKKFKIVDYKQGIAQEDKPPEEKEIIDPNTKQKKKVKVQPQKIRIGVLLKDNPELQKEYNEDEVRVGSKTKQYSIVISRHPYDIAGMSTDRGWTSCMNLQGGCNAHYVTKDVEHGSLVSYLISVDDKNIQNPLARILIHPYTKEKNRFLQTKKIYGLDVPGFKEKVQNILNQTVNKNFEKAGHRHPELYSDGEPDRLISDKEYQQWLEEPDWSKIPGFVGDDRDFQKQYVEKHWDRLLNEPDRDKIPWDPDYEFRKQYGEKHWDRLLNEPDRDKIPGFIRSNQEFQTQYGLKHYINEPEWHKIPYFLINNQEFRTHWIKLHQDRFLNEPNWKKIPLVFRDDPEFRTQWMKTHPE